MCLPNRDANYTLCVLNERLSLPAYSWSIGMLLLVASRLLQFGTYQPFMFF